MWIDGAEKGGELGATLDEIAREGARRMLMVALGAGTVEVQAPRVNDQRVDYVYIWVDGIHPRVRLGQDKLCLLVVLGVRPDGTKELVGLARNARAARRVPQARQQARGTLQPVTVTVQSPPSEDRT